MEIEVSTEVRATPAVLWETLTDVARWPDRISTMTSVVRLDEGSLVVGSEARIRQPMIGTMTWLVTDLQPEASFTWVARRPGIVVEAQHEVAEVAAGVQRLTLRIRQGGLLGRGTGWLLRRPLKRALAIEAEAHRVHAEAAR